MKLSQQAVSIKPSATLEISAKAAAMRAEGIDVLSLSAGEPDFDTPESVRMAAVEAMNGGKTRYTASAGIPELRAAIAEATGRDYGLAVDPAEVIVTSGAKQALYLTIMALVDPGDEVLIPSPYWVSYPHQVRLCGGKPVIVETSPENRFRLTARQLEAAITDRTKALMLNSPSNPTGEVYSRKEMEALAEVVIEHDIAVICDDIYDKLVYDGTEFVSMSQISTEARKRSIIVNGVSKSSAMTGWRIGWLIADKALATATARFQGQMTSHPDSIAQYASVEAVAGKRDYLPGWVAQFQARRDRIVELLNDIEGISCALPQGAFYVFPDFRALLGRKAGGKTLEDDMAWAAYLIEKGHVASVPGTPFGAPGFIRLSFATSIEIIEEGVERIRRAIAETAQ